MTTAPVPLAEQPKNEQDAARLEDLRRRHCSIVSSHPCDEKAIGRWPPCDAAFLLRLLDEARSKLEASNYALDRVREQRVANPGGARPALLGIDYGKNPSYTVIAIECCCGERTSMVPRVGSYDWEVRCAGCGRGYHVTNTSAPSAPPTGPVELGSAPNTDPFPNNNVAATPAGKGETG